MKNTHSRILIAMATVAFLAVTSCSHDKDKTAATQAPVIDVAMPVVDTVTVYKTYPGYLSARGEVDLVARVNGYLLSNNYQPGTFVKRGTVLFNIESKQYADAVNQARAELEDARATYAYASKNYAAMKRALESDAVSQMEVLESKSAMEKAAAAISDAQAALSTAQTTLSYCTVRAPFDGHVSDAIYDPGTYLAGAASPVTLCTIYDDAVLSVNFNIGDSELKQLTNNLSKQLDIDMTRIPVEFGDTMPHQYTADLTYLAPALDVSTGQMLVKARIENLYGDLRAGMVANVKLPTKIVPDGILIEDAAISKDQLGQYVYVVNDSNKVVYTPVKTGELITPTLRLVTDGLKAGDRYVTKAMLKVRDGMTVKPRLTK